MNIDGYILENPTKVERAINGTPTANGGTNGGVGVDGNILAEYDRIGGLITKNGRKVKTGSFFDFKANKVKKNPDVVFLIRVGDEEVEVAEGEPMPIEVQAAEILDKKKKAGKGRKAKSLAEEMEETE